MSKPSKLPVLARQDASPVITPVVPLNFVYPGLSLLQIFSIIWGHWKISLVIITLVLSITVVAIKLWPRTYTAEVTLMVNYEVNDPLNGKELPIGQLGSYIATQIELIQNQGVLLEVIETLELTLNKDYTAGYTGKTGTLEQWIVEQLRKNLTVNQGQYGSQILYVSFSANNPNLSAEVANAIAETYKKQDELRSISQPVERSARYAEKLAELKQNVEFAQQKVTEFHKRNDLIDEGNRANFDVVMLASLEERLLEAQNERRLAEARVLGDQSVSDGVLASPEVQALKAQLAEQQLQLAKLQKIYTPEYPDLLDLQSSIVTIKEALDSALHKYAANELEKLSVAKQLEKSLQISVAKQRVKVLANSKLHDEAGKYVLALESARSLYKRVLDEYDQLKFSTSGHSNINIVSRATPPLKASKPRVMKGLLLGAVVAFMLGIGIPLAYELFNRRVRCRDDLERDHGISVLAELSGDSMRAAA